VNARGGARVQIVNSSSQRATMASVRGGVTSPNLMTGRLSIRFEILVRVLLEGEVGWSARLGS